MALSLQNLEAAAAAVAVAAGKQGIGLLRHVGAPALTPMQAGVVLKQRLEGAGAGAEEGVEGLQPQVLVVAVA